MKYIMTATVLVLCFIEALAQENIGLFQGGYSTGMGDVTPEKPTGFKINAAWEYNPNGERWTIGGSLGYIRLTGEEPGTDYSVSAVPITLVSRLMFGSETFKGFIRGQGGMHISTVSYSGLLINQNDTQLSMAAGIGGGVMFFANEKTFVSAEYEWLWLANAFSNTGSIGTVALGVGFKF